MEISNNKGLFGINNPLINNNGSAKKYHKLAPLNKDTVSFRGETNSSDAPESRPKQVSRKSSDNIIKRIEKMTDEEFEALKTQVQEKFELLSDDIKYEFEHTTLTKENILIADKILSDKKLYGSENFMNEAGNIIFWTETPKDAQAKSDLIDKILSDKRLYGNEDVMNKAGDIISCTNRPEQVLISAKILSDERLYGNDNFMKKLEDILRYTRTQREAQIRSDIIDKILSDKRLYGNEKLMNKAGDIILGTYLPEQLKIATKIFSDEKLFANDNFINYASDIISASRSCTNEQIKIINKILSDERLFCNDNFLKNAYSIICNSKTEEQAQLANKILSDERLYGNRKFMNNVGYIIGDTRSQREAQIRSDIIDKIFSDEKLYGNKTVMNYLVSIIEVTKTNEKSQLANKILSDERLYGNDDFMNNAGNIISKIYTSEQAAKAIKILDYKEITAQQALHMLSRPDEISYKEIKKLNRVIGFHNAEKLNLEDIKTAVKFVELYKKNNINELSSAEKKQVLRSLVEANADLFKTSDDLRKMFPILPKDQEEYCALLPSLVRSLGIETNTLTSERVEQFDSDLSSLSESLKTISDEDFSNLEISQGYPKEQFIQDTIAIVKDLAPAERQKVYDYFGFELHHNKNGTVNPEVSKSGFSISGYPVNLNNGKKLAQITDENTKKVVEQLRPIVVKFSQDNPIKCNNKDVEKLLNNVVDVLPELRPQIGKTQHGTHDFDVLTHSLKVMQKISQDEKFDGLNASDKKLMLLASLLHDITKKEGSIDKTHAAESSFDTYFIAKKFNLSQEEQTKLYTLTRHHEWLEYVNTAKDEKDLEKRLKSVAYDLRNDNLFDMALMFSHADLKAVKTDDSFHDKTTGDSRTDFNGITKSFGERADILAGKPEDDVNSNTIRGYINELKKSQPLLPVTKIPSASTISKAITTVNEDGSTNIKGVYKDKDGLVIIKYNEVENEDWEKIGFPKGSISKGIQADGKHRDRFWKEGDEAVDTGTIKFFAHGLDYANQLIKFDAFPMPDSDALLSVSYAERPESKYRFFRPQGILLDADAKYVHGGGETDAGSGCSKNIQDFKDDYLFGGYREKDRLYVSNLIKEALEIDDEEYVKFVKENENKPLSEIEPEETREKLVKAFASINSKTRGYGRAYNEMYISNPQLPMAVYAYSTDYNNLYDNPVEFLNGEYTSKYEPGAKQRTQFLREYALERDIPFFVFGD